SRGVAGRLPRNPANVGAVGVDDGVEDPRVLAPHGQATPPHRPGRQPLGQPLPGLACVAGPIQSRLWPELHDGVAAGEGIAADPVGGGVQRLRVGVVDGQVNAAGVRVQLQDVVPALAAVPSAEDAALPVGAPQVAQPGDVSDFGVFGVDDDSADVV